MATDIDFLPHVRRSTTPSETEKASQQNLAISNTFPPLQSAKNHQKLYIIITFVQWILLLIS